MQYDLELGKVIAEIRKENAKTVGIQLADGLKPRAEEIQKEIQEKTGAKVIFWADTCFGACDLAIDLSRLGCDLLVQFGHSEWR
jgi:2-(3-amino-3-carboxypropyl)histidine synthase